jgi:hypothetical protein
MTEYSWDTIFQLLAEENLQHYISITQLKQAVHNDDPQALSLVLGDHKHAAIYAFIYCFVRPPALRCIHYLVAKGTPLNQTFVNNPFQQTPLEFLHKRYSSNDETYLLIKQTIDRARKSSDPLIMGKTT